MYLFLALVLLVVPMQALAAELGTGAAVSPTYTEHSVKAGQRISGKLTVKNDGTELSEYTTSAGGATIKNEEYERNYANTPNPEQLESWVQFEKTTFTLKPQERTNIGYTITVPQNAAPGTHYAALFVSTKGKPNSIGIASIKRVGSHLYVTVDGVLERVGKLDSFNAKMWQNGAPVEASVRMVNTGNVHYFADVKYVITDFFGNEKYRFNNNLVVLPNAPRRIALTWDKAPAFGFFKLGGTVHYFDKTEKLPTRHVLVLSSTAFLLMLLAVGALGAYAYFSRPKNVRRR